MGSGPILDWLGDLRGALPETDFWGFDSQGALVHDNFLYFQLIRSVSRFIKWHDRLNRDKNTRRDDGLRTDDRPLRVGLL